MLAVGTNRGTIILANSRGDKREYNSDGRSGKVFCVALSPEGRTLASGSQDGSLQLWDVMSGEIVRSLRGSSAQGREASEKDLQASRLGSVEQHGAPCRSVAWCPCSRLLASGGDDGQVFIWDTEAPSSIPLNAFWGDRAGVRSVAFAPDGSGRVASGGGRGSIMLFNRESGREWARLDAHADQVRAVAFSPDGARLASAGADAAVLLWDTVGGALLCALAHSCQTADTVAWSTSGELACGGDDMSVRVYDSETGLLSKCFKGHDGSEGCSCRPLNEVQTHDGFSGHHDWTWAVATPGGWADPNCKRQGHRDSVRALAFAPGGQQLASGSWDGVVKVWDARGQLLRSLDAGSLVLAVDFGPDWTREAREAVALAMHERCGAASPLRPLEVGVVRMILDFLPCS